ncbi:hypothetical protein Pta02_28340 [Planobispora takensis]|uniref:Uncharacterized protein n=1 Tax=Planobispora takensis TaxID=1367882 RepID=A0A8J3SXY9_9ACTN|nr:hypothetical protein Pta02_28340 [Planobispora takensis]
MPESGTVTEAVYPPGPRAMAQVIGSGISGSRPPRGGSGDPTGLRRCRGGSLGLGDLSGQSLAPRETRVGLLRPARRYRFGLPAALVVACYTLAVLTAAVIVVAGGDIAILQWLVLREETELHPDLIRPGSWLWWSVPVLVLVGGVQGWGLWQILRWTRSWGRSCPTSRCGAGAATTGSASTSTGCPGRVRGTARSGC